MASTRRRPSLDTRPRLSHHNDVDDFPPLSPRALRGQSMISPSRPKARDALKTDDDLADLAAFLRGTGPAAPITVRSPTFDDDLPPIKTKRGAFFKEKLSTLRKNSSRPELKTARTKGTSAGPGSPSTSPSSPPASLSSASLRSSIKQDEFSQQLKMGSLTKKVLPNGVSYYAIATPEESSELKLPVSSGSFGTFQFDSQLDLLSGNKGEAAPKSARLEPRSARAEPRQRSSSHSDDGRRLTLTQALAQGPGMSKVELNAARRARLNRSGSVSDLSSVSTDSAPTRSPNAHRRRRDNRSSPASSPALQESIKMDDSPEVPSRTSSRGQDGAHIETDGVQSNGWSHTAQSPSLAPSPALTTAFSVASDALSDRARHGSLKPPKTPPSARSDVAPRVFSPADFARSSSRSSISGSKRAASNASTPSQIPSPGRRAVDTLETIPSKPAVAPATPPQSNDAVLHSKHSFSTALTSPSRKVPQSPPSMQRTIQLSSAKPQRTHRARPRTAPEGSRARNMSMPSPLVKSMGSPQSAFDLVLNDQVPITPRTAIAFTRAASEDIASKVSTESSFRQTVTAPTSPLIEALDEVAPHTSDSAEPTVDTTGLPVLSTKRNNDKRGGLCISNVDLAALKLPLMDLADASSLHTADNADCVSIAFSARSWKDAASELTGKEAESVDLNDDDDEEAEEVLANVEESTTLDHSTLRAGSATRPSTGVRSALGLDIGSPVAEADKPLYGQAQQEHVDGNSLDEFSHPAELWKGLQAAREEAALYENASKTERARCCQLLKRCMAMLELQRRQLRAAEAAKAGAGASQAVQSPAPGSPGMSERLASDEQRLTSLIADLLEFIGHPPSKVEAARAARSPSQAFASSTLPAAKPEVDADAVVLRARKATPTPRASGIARPVTLIRSHSLSSGRRPSITAHHRHSSLSVVSHVAHTSPLRDGSASLPAAAGAGADEAGPSATSEAALYARSIASP